MSRFLQVLLTTSGLTREEVTFFDAGRFVRDAKERGLLVALRNAVLNVVLRATWLLWKLFAPYVLVRQVLAVVILQVTYEGIIPLIKYLVHSALLPVKRDKDMDALEKRIRDLEAEMEKAETYDEWRETARTVEALRNQKACSFDEVINTKRVQRMKAKTELYKRLVEQEDACELQFRLRSELHRKSWGLGSMDDLTTRENPYYRAALHEYLDAVCSALALITRGGKKKTPSGVDPMSDEAPLLQDEDEPLEKKITNLRGRLDFFSETLHSFGRTALLLSGGARLGLLHLGVVRALLDQKLLPRVISGSSAGSIVAVMLGAYRDDELEDKLFDPASLNLKFFQLASDSSKETSAAKNPLVSSLLLLPPPLPALVHALASVVPNWYTTGTLLDVQVLAKAIRDATGDLTFKEAFERTGRIINITVSPSGDADYPMLLNYLTAPQVLLWSASVASCAIPGVFAPVELMAKDMDGNIVPYYHETLKWADGSVEADLPMQRLSELFNINHFVVSQVNPHARFLAPMSRKARVKSHDPSAFNRITHKVLTAMDETTKVVVNFCRDQSRSSVQHLASSMILLSPLFPLFSPLKLLGKSIVPILTQQYTGDITIMPPMTYKGMVTILTNPSPDEYLDDLMRGERVTWPHISRMRLHVAIEFLLEDCRNSCRRQLARLEQELLETGSMATHSPRLGGPRMSFHTSSRRRLDSGIPTASVLNLHDLDISSAVYKPSNGLSRARRGSSMESNMTDGNNPSHARMARNTSFLGLNEKLKSRVQSFAADLSVLGRPISDGPEFPPSLDDDEDGTETVVGAGI